MTYIFLIIHHCMPFQYQRTGLSEPGLPLERWLTSARRARSMLDALRQYPLDADAALVAAEARLSVSVGELVAPSRLACAG